ncbi:MAG: hypothetical protein NTW04_00610, partial [Elusimicrobia bacterium]|nr:hypothetical protein [Elusimicrobiota bacterium]
KGIYAIVKADPSKPRHGTVVLQGNGAASAFVHETLPELKKLGLNLNVFYITSAELFMFLDESEREKIYPQELAVEAMGITDFTLPTMYRWVKSPEGIRRTLYPFRGGKFLGSGQGHKVLEEAGIDGKGQFIAIADYAKSRRK